MGRPLENSLMALAFEQITNSPGSPYFAMTCQIKAGGLLYNPMKITRFVMGMDFVKNFSDELYIYVAIPRGDVIEHISPFQDDLSMEIRIMAASQGSQVGDEEEYLTRIYRAYLEDQVKSPIEMSNTEGEPNIDMTNIGTIDIVCFRLEEIGVEQMRLIRTGMVVRDEYPMKVADALLRQYANSIQLEDEERILGPTIDEGFNKTKRTTITIPDGTPLLDVPDMMQNKMGGIYKEALGFYIRNNHIHLWPLYKLDREETAKRTLRIYVSPDPKSNVVEHSWRVPPDDPFMVEMWVGGNISVMDSSFNQLQEFGTGIRNVDPSRVLDGFRKADTNCMFLNFADNNMIFKATTLVNDRNVVNSTVVTTNPYLLTSKMAKMMGMEVTLTWHHSLPTKLVPGMRVELVYDYHGVIRVVEGNLLEALSSIDVLGAGLTTHRFQSLTMLKVFVSRNDFIYDDWVDGEAALEHSTVPPRNNLFEK